MSTVPLQRFREQAESDMKSVFSAGVTSARAHE